MEVSREYTISCVYQESLAQYYVVRRLGMKPGNRQSNIGGLSLCELFGASFLARYLAYQCPLHLAGPEGFRGRVGAVVNGFFAGLVVESETAGKITTLPCLNPSRSYEEETGVLIPFTLASRTCSVCPCFSSFQALRNQGQMVPEVSLAHLPPLKRENINLTGDYTAKNLG